MNLFLFVAFSPPPHPYSVFILVLRVVFISPPRDSRFSKTQFQRGIHTFVVIDIFFFLYILLSFFFIRVPINCFRIHAKKINFLEVLLHHRYSYREYNFISNVSCNLFTQARFLFFNANEYYEILDGMNTFDRIVVSFVELFDVAFSFHFSCALALSHIHALTLLRAKSDLFKNRSKKQQSNNVAWKQYHPI